MGQLVLQDVSKAFHDHLVVQQINLTIDDGEFVVIVGPSGSGKSTLLRMIAGLEEMSAGQMFLDGELVNDVLPQARNIGMVFQSYALYPHMTVGENMAYSLTLARRPKAETARRVRAVAGSLQLTPLLARKPAALSGGQRQRVAIGRALIKEPSLFLFDEPLSNLDAALRVDMRVQIARLHQKLRSTMIYVTHDQVEAMTLADRIIMMSAGQIAQSGTPLTLYHSPATLEVATFIGSPRMNILPVRIDKASAAGVTVRLADNSLLLVAVDGRDAVAGQPAFLGVRPEDVLSADAGEVKLAATLVLREHLGHETLSHFQLAGAEEMIIQRSANGNLRPLHSPVLLGLSGARCHLFADDGRAWPRLTQSQSAA